VTAAGRRGPSAGRAASAAEAARKERRAHLLGLRGMVSKLYAASTLPDQPHGRQTFYGLISVNSAAYRVNENARSPKKLEGKKDAAKPPPGWEAPIEQDADGVGRVIARYLQKPIQRLERLTRGFRALRDRCSPATCSWSRATITRRRHQIPDPIDVVAFRAVCRTARGRVTADGEPHVLIEANVGEGVVSAPLSKYTRFDTASASAV